MELSIVLFTLVVFRVGGFVSAMPLFGGPSLPATVKVGLSVGLTLLWYEMAAESPPEWLIQSMQDTTWAGFAIAVGREVMLGVFLGFTFGLFLLPARMAGSWIGHEMGLELANLTDPTRETSGTLYGQLSESAAMLLFLALDLHHVPLAALHLSFDRLPIGETPAVNPVTTAFAINGFQYAHEQSLSIAAPVGTALFLMLVVLLLLMKAAPQLNLFSVGLSLRLGAGTLAGLVFLPESYSLMARSMISFREIVFRAFSSSG